MPKSKLMMLVAKVARPLLAFGKSEVKGHERHLGDGKVVFVAAHSDSRKSAGEYGAGAGKSHAEHAAFHSAQRQKHRDIAESRRTPDDDVPNHRRAAQAHLLAEARHDEARLNPRQPERSAIAHEASRAAHAASETTKPNSAPSHSETCPKCKTKMHDVHVSGDQLHAKCHECGWKGSKTKGGAPLKKSRMLLLKNEISGYNRRSKHGLMVFVKPHRRHTDRRQANFEMASQHERSAEHHRAMAKQARGLNEHGEADRHDNAAAVHDQARQRFLESSSAKSEAAMLSHEAQGSIARTHAQQHSVAIAEGRAAPLTPDDSFAYENGTRHIEHHRRAAGRHEEDAAEHHAAGRHDIGELHNKARKAHEAAASAFHDARSTPRESEDKISAMARAIGKHDKAQKASRKADKAEGL